MPGGDVEVVVVGGGAAGVAAAKRLCQASVRCVLVEARPRLGGRAWTVIDGVRLHARSRLRLAALRRSQSVGRVSRKEQGASIDKTPPPWTRPSLEAGFPRAEQEEFRQALRRVL